MQKIKLLTITLLLSMLTVPTGMRADDKQNTLIVLTKDNVLHHFVLADKP